LKALGLGLLAAMAVAATGGGSATANTSGHFVSEAKEHYLVVKGISSGAIHSVNFQRTVNGEPSGEPIRCTSVTYHGTLAGSAATTSQEISLWPRYEGCSTSGIAPHNIAIDIPTGCQTNVLKFTSGVPGTVHVECEITFTHPNCTTRIPKQTLSGATYTTVTESEINALTIDLSFASTTIHYEGGVCVFLGTTQTFDLAGSLTLWGEDTEGNRVGITHTE